MKILIVHNRYRIRAGEDAVFECEKELLIKNQNIVDTFISDNMEIKTMLRKIKAGIFSIYNPFSAADLRKKIGVFKPDIIHVHNFFPLISPSIFRTASKMKIPVVMTLHNFRLLCVNGILFRRGQICEKCEMSKFPYHGITGRCYRNSMILSANIALLNIFHSLLNTWRKKIDRYIVLTKLQEEKIARSALQIDRSKIVKKPNFISDPGPGNKKREPFFLFIGRLSSEKGINTLIKSFRTTSYKIKIFGKGPLREIVKNEAKKNGNIIYFGFKEREIILREMKRSSALIFPSECYEGFPVVILEAFATGTPVISSDIGSQAEIVDDGFNGIHFRAGDSKDLAEKVKEFAMSPDVQKFSKNARSTYLSNYTPGKNYKRLIEIYNEAIDEKTKSS